MDMYIVVSEVEDIKFTQHYIHYISSSLDNAINAYENIDRKEKDGILLIKLQNDKVFDYELFGISNYDEDIEIIRAFPDYNYQK